MGGWGDGVALVNLFHTFVSIEICGAQRFL